MPNFITNRFTTIQNYFSTQQLPGADLKRLYSWEFWVEAYIEPNSAYLAITLLLLGLALIGLLLWRSSLKKAHRRVPVYSTPISALTNLVFFVVIMTIGYLFFRYQSLAYASSRLVVLATTFVSLGWLGWIFWQIKRTVPSAEASYLERERFFRYLPKKQGKK